jgi:hypothetical protein
VPLIYKEPVIGRIELVYFVSCPRSMNEVLLDRAYVYQGGRKSRSARRRLEGNSSDKLRYLRECQRLDVEDPMLDEMRAASR